MIWVRAHFHIFYSKRTAEKRVLTVTEHLSESTRSLGEFLDNNSSNQIKLYATFREIWQKKRQREILHGLVDGKNWQ